MISLLPDGVSTWMRLPAEGEIQLSLNIPVGLVSVRESVCERLILVERRAWQELGPVR